MEQKYSDSKIPASIKKKMESLIDLRKDFADIIHEIKLALENSWEELEKNADSLLENLNASIKSLKSSLKKL